MKKFLFIIDPFSRLHLEKDTSVLMINEALRRGYQTYTTTASLISRYPEGLRALVSRHQNLIGKSVSIKEDKDEVADLSEFDLIIIRKDPPFDESYLALCLLLRGLSGPRVVNNPDSLLRYNEKLTILLFPQYITNTIVSCRSPRIADFIDRVGGKGVAKPLFQCSGRGIKLLDRADPHFSDELTELTAGDSRHIMVQKYLPAVQGGETRVFMLEDRIVSVMKKIPRAGSFKANFDCGARGVAVELGPRDRRICSEVGEFCRKEGILLSALDIIDGNLSEINITSPGLLVEANQVNKASTEREIIEFLGSCRN